MAINDNARTEIKKLAQQGEDLTLEFKSDTKGLPDRDLVVAIVSLANTEGGDLLLGVEDDGSITGLHPNHEYDGVLQRRRLMANGKPEAVHSIHMSLFNGNQDWA